MKLFTNGGTCATPASRDKIRARQEMRAILNGYATAAERDMQQRKRNEQRMDACKNGMGATYLLHPDNQGVSWRGGL